MKVDDATDLLNGMPDDAPPLAFPHSSQIERSGNLFVLLHAIERAGAKVPEHDIRPAHERMRDFQARMDSVPRVRPRAAGRDAPDERRAEAAEDPGLDRAYQF